MRMAVLAARARRAARQVPHGRRHAVVLAGMVGSYAHLERGRGDRPAADAAIVEGVLEELGVLARLALAVFAARERVGALARALRSPLHGASRAPALRVPGAAERRAPMLELRELVKHYPAVGGDPVRAVDGVSLSVAEGEMVALYGPSGSGKTTLLLMIAALLAPSSGSVFVDGRDVSLLSEQQASRFRLSELGFVRQSFDLLPGVSAIDNAVLKLLSSVRWREAHARVLPLLERLGLGERLEHRAETLSMGERQRVMIARALSTEPRLLLADEPTGSLDTQRSREVLGLLRELCRERGVAVVLVSHDPLAASYADRVLALEDGRLQDHEPDR